MEGDSQDAAADLQGTAGFGVAASRETMGGGLN
jgi:hypothetical protein